MKDQNFVRGLFLAAISLAFGLTALRYPIGDFSRAGAGLFPLLVSGLLLLIAIATLVRARLSSPVPIDFNLKNIALIMLALCSFALASKLLDMVVGIVLMVFISGFAASSYSWQRNLKISAGLVVIAFGFKHLLGLNLPLL